MKKVLFILVMLLSVSIYAQQPTYKVAENGQLEKVQNVKPDDEKTGYTVEIKGVKYPVYKSQRGKYYIIRTSKNTGNQYKQYIKIES